MQAQLYEFFRTSFSAEHFRRWVSHIAPNGMTLAQALPSAPVDALTLFSAGAELLVRYAHVDAAMFESLAREFPKRSREIVELAEANGVELYGRLRRFVGAALSPVQARRWLGAIDPELAVGDDVDADVRRVLRDRPPDPAMFDLLALEVPARREELVALARGYSVRWTEPGTRRTWAAIAGALAGFGVVVATVLLVLGMTEEAHPLAIVLAHAEPSVEPPTIVRVELPDRPVPAEDSPSSATGSGGETSKVERSHDDRKGHRTHGSGESGGDSPRSDPPAPCRPEALLPRLRALAQQHLTRDAETVDFTVLLRSDAVSPQVSPAPKAGQTARKHLYDELRRLGPDELGSCRGSPIDITFTLAQTTVVLRKPAP